MIFSVFTAFYICQQECRKMMKNVIENWNENKEKNFISFFAWNHKIGPNLIEKSISHGNHKKVENEQIETFHFLFHYFSH